MVEPDNVQDPVDRRRTQSIYPAVDPLRYTVLASRISGGKRLAVLCSPDRVKAWLWLDPSTAWFRVEKGEISAVIETSGVAADAAKLERARTYLDALSSDRDRFDRAMFQPLLIAEGRHPQHGEDGYAEWCTPVPREHEIRLTEDERGRIDFRELGRVVNVVEGQELAVLHPPTEGEDGFDVFGARVPAQPGRPVQLLAGDHVSYDEETRMFRAVQPGRVFLRGPEIGVEPVYEVPGDVDLRVGNIDFIGTVSVQRNVCDGFLIKARNHILVGGLIGDAALEAGGDIRAGVGVTMKQGGSLQCSRLVARHLVNARVDCRGDVLADTQIVNSRIECTGRVFVPHGAVVGGRVSALGGMEIHEAGSPAGTRTVLMVSIDTFGTPATRALDGEIGRVIEQMARIQTRLGPFIDNRALVDDLTEDRQPMILKLLDELERFKQQCVELQNRRDALMAGYAGAVKEEILVKSYVHPGVDVWLDNCRRVFTETIEGPLRMTPNYDRGDIEIRAV